MGVSTDGIGTMAFNLIKGKVRGFLEDHKDSVFDAEEEVRNQKAKLAEAQQADRDLRKQVITLNGQIETAQQAYNAAEKLAMSVLTKGQQPGANLEDAKAIANEHLKKVAPQKTIVDTLTPQRDLVQQNRDKVSANIAETEAYIFAMENEIAMLKSRLQANESLQEIQEATTLATMDPSGLEQKMAALRADVVDQEATVQAGIEQVAEKSGRDSSLDDRTKAFLGEAESALSPADALLAKMSSGK